MPEAIIYDLALTPNESIETEEGLKTLITISLLTRGQARPEDVLADPTDRGGWWGDAYADIPGQTVGSRLWTLKGRKINNALLVDMDQMIRDALQWLVDAGHLGQLEVELEVIGHGIVGATIGVRRPNAAIVSSLGLWELSV